jgi:hypothetical protein
MSHKFAADFETTTQVDDCRVWAYSLCEIGCPDNFLYGNNIDDFIKFCANPKENYILYFHNLKFDSEFIFNYLLNSGYTCIKDKKDRQDKTFTTLISEMNQIYSIEIFFEIKGKRTNKVTIYDSLKILNFSVEQIAKDFDLPIRKLELDYNAKREVGHKLTEHEIEYIRNDVEIMARALDYMFKIDLKKMTIGGDALFDYKKIISSFTHYFPILPYEIDQDIRQSYRGGFTYLNECYKGATLGEGCVLDVNSLYPSVMYNELLPFGEPLFFDGKYEEDKLYPLYVQSISVAFEIKKDHIPTIQLKNNINFIPTEYITSSKGDIVDLVLTNIDLQLFKEHYNIEYIKYHNGWKFKGIKGLFRDYIDKWTRIKIESKKQNNLAMYRISKLLLNSLYGKFGLNPNIRSKYPALDDKGIVTYKFYDKEIREPIYIPMAAFITSYARNKTIRTSQSIKEYSIKNYGKDYYIYSDTDSIHSLFTDSEILKQFVDIDDYRLGAWKLESRFIKGKYLRAKSYIEMSPEGKLNCTVAGLPKNLGDVVDFDNFKIGNSYFGKMIPLHVKGGLILKPDYFTIREK